MEAIETTTHEGLSVSIYIDEDAQSPDDWDNLATFAHWADYTFGNPIAEPDRSAVYIRALTMLGDAVAVIPVYIVSQSYTLANETTPDHANGVLYTTHARLNELCGEDPKYHTREFAEEALRSELRIWNQYLGGEVYGYVIEDAAGEERDSLWGLYGLEYARQAARESAAYCADELRTDEAKESAEQTYWAAMDVATVQS